MLLFPFVSLIALGCLALRYLSSLDSFHLPPFAYCVCLASAMSPSLSPSLSFPLCSHGVSPNFCLLWHGTLWSSSCLPQFPIISTCLQGVFQRSPTCLPLVRRLSPSCVPVVSQISPRCGFPGVPVSSKVSPRVVYLSSTSLPHVLSQWSPDVVSQLLPDVVSQMFPPSCLQCFSICCLIVFACPPDVVSQLRQNFNTC